MQTPAGVVGLGADFEGPVELRDVGLEVEDVAFDHLDKLHVVATEAIPKTGRTGLCLRPGPANGDKGKPDGPGACRDAPAHSWQAQASELLPQPRSP